MKVMKEPNELSLHESEVFITSVTDEEGKVHHEQAMMVTKVPKGYLYRFNIEEEFNVDAMGIVTIWSTATFVPEE